MISLFPTEQQPLCGLLLHFGNCSVSGSIAWGTSRPLPGSGKQPVVARPAHDMTLADVSASSERDPATAARIERERAACCNSAGSAFFQARLKLIDGLLEPVAASLVTEPDDSTAVHR